MTYTAKEQSEIEGSPAELYEFKLGGTVFRFTSQSEAVTFGGFVYLPATIKRNSPKLSTERSSLQLLVTVPTRSAIAQEFVALVPTSRMSLTIFRQHRTDTPTPETITWWKGFVTGAKFKDEVTELICEPIQALFAREIPRASYSGLCNHVLYDTGCRVDRLTFSDNVDVTSISTSGDELVLDSLSTARPADTTFYTGGFVERSNGDKRLILEYTFATDTVRILLPFENLVVGETVVARAGCAHDIVTCRDKFNIVPNFGGFPWSPESNPFLIGIGDQ